MLLKVFQKRKIKIWEIRGYLCNLKLLPFLKNLRFSPSLRRLLLPTVVTLGSADLNTTICSFSLFVLRSFTREFFKSNVKRSVDFPSSNEYSYLLHRSSIRFNQVRLKPLNFSKIPLPNPTFINPNKPIPPFHLKKTPDLKNLKQLQNQAFSPPKLGFCNAFCFSVYLIWIWISIKGENRAKFTNSIRKFPDL